MSTYNGEEYLKEQIESILKQDCQKKTGVKLKLFIRDDGSSDGTQKILDEYMEKYPEIISWYQGENIGVIRSFFELIEKSDNDAEYYAFSDQDDYWHKEKLSAGIEKLRKMADAGKKEAENSDIPLLYCCSPLLVDENLKELDNEMTRKTKKPKFENAVVENIVTGCTIVMNKTLRDMAKAQPPKFTVMHDWWFYLLASCYGKIYYDKEQYISYRQHGTNTVGYNTSKIKEFKDRLKRFKRNRQNITKQLSEFVRIYKAYIEKEADNKLFLNNEVKSRIELADELSKYSKKIKYIPKRISILKNSGICRQRKIDDIVFKIILLSGSY
mgnify:CR=1 FL=1